MGDSPGGDDDGGPLGGSRTVTGEVVDFQTSTTLDGATSVSTAGVVPAPRVTSQGASFTIEGIPDNSTFQILAAAPPTHRATFSPAVEVVTTDVSGVKAPVVSETFLAGIASAFGVTPSAARGVLLARLVDANGAPRAGIASDQLVLAGGDGPHFLDANLMAAPAAKQSSTSGWVVFFEVAPGLVQLGAAAAPTVTLDMAASPVNAGAVTLATIEVIDGAPVLPTNVSFANQIVPIFSNRGCIACHSGGGIGKDLGGLKLDGGTNSIYSEVVDEDPTRVVKTNPPTSLILTMPSPESPPDTHPNITFASANDPDYQKLLVWIREGARNN
ncbi:MAG TPA: hypothetical protein VFQ53_22185 [Kofleriaceae bacterium]|nr:hypothetical protein [Kofleriaceae bacterium]